MTAFGRIVPSDLFTPGCVIRLSNPLGTYLCLLIRRSSALKMAWWLGVVQGGNCGIQEHCQIDD